MNKSRLIALSTALMLLFLLAGVVQASTIPTFSITAVEEDATVTIYTYDFPAGKIFQVLMGEIGTKGVDGIEVDIIESGEGGSMEFTFMIPEELKGEELIAIRLEGTDSDYYAYNWFPNTTVPAEEGEDITAPTFSILSVEKDSTVTIYTENFPAEEYFYVLMGEYGTKGVDGSEVDIIESGAGGSFSITFLIPEELMGIERIAIRLEGVESEYYAYNWFWNRTTPSDEEAYSGIPTFSILSVVEDSAVTIVTENFPAEESFVVFMGEYGTKGVDGIEVSTIESGMGGSMELSFAIPEELMGEERIAIRLEGVDSDYYAFNWFWNRTTPSDEEAYSGIPTFSILSVEEDSTVIIETDNFPAGESFNLMMGEYGTKGVDGILIDTIDSGEGGSFSLGLLIPEELIGQKRIAIRLEGVDSGYYAYNWFWNNTTEVE